MLFSISGKKSLRQNNMVGNYIGVVGGGWGGMSDLTRFAREDGLQSAGATNMFGLLYTPSMTPMVYGDR